MKAAGDRYGPEQPSRRAGVSWWGGRSKLTSLALSWTTGSTVSCLLVLTTGAHHPSPPEPASTGRCASQRMFPAAVTLPLFSVVNQRAPPRPRMLSTRDCCAAEGDPIRPLSWLAGAPKRFRQGAPRGLWKIGSANPRWTPGAMPTGSPLCCVPTGSFQHADAARLLAVPQADRCREREGAGPDYTT